jgi:SAM-dependent methyltransferase
MSEHQHGHAHGHGHDADISDDQELGAEFWNERYASAPAIWSGRPNPQLVAEAGQLSPGRALDVGAGEGADAIWLAEHRWTVTAVDISSIALERAAEHARAAGDDVASRISFEERDFTAWAPPAGSFDLVSAQFVHVPPARRDALNAALAAAVAPGGVLLIVGHHPLDLETGLRRPSRADLLFTADDVVGVLDPAEWEILATEARPRTATGPDGADVGVHDAVLLARRRP